MSAPSFTREDMVDAIATAISDSMDVDWNSRTGAEAVVRNCGVFELYQLVEQFERVAVYEIRKLEREKPEDDEGIRLRSLNLALIRDALAKTRGEQVPA